MMVLIMVLGQAEAFEIQRTPFCRIDHVYVYQGLLK